MKKNKKSSDIAPNVTKHTPMAIDFDALKQRLVEEDAFISKIINTIPSKLYFDQDVQEKITARKHQAMDKAATAFKRRSSAPELSSRNKHKRARLDPLQYKPVSEIQKETESQRKSKKNSSFLSASLERAANIEELQKRLQNRIKELEAKRKGCSDDAFQEKKRLKTKLKKIKKRQRGNLKKAIENGPTPALPIKQPKVEKPDLKPKPIYNKDGKIIYSKFDFTDSAETAREDRKKKKRLGSKNLKKMLMEVEKDKEKIQTLKEEDRNKAKSLIEKKAWEKAILKAEGVKIKDDPTLLKKTLKKKEKQKAKSAKEWQQRKEHTEFKMKKRQEKRKKNIQARKQDKMDKKVKRVKKKGRIIPGF